jgi:hypothetical protein
MVYRSHAAAAAGALQGAMLLLVGPWVDAWVSGRWVFSYTMTMPALGVLLLSCCFSVGVNVSQFMCLGRFSAATFQVGCVLLAELLRLQDYLEHGVCQPLCCGWSKCEPAASCAWGVLSGNKPGGLMRLGLGAMSSHRAVDQQPTSAKLPLLQVLGHTKTVLVLLISWLALGEAMSSRKAAGMAVAVSGMIAYGYCVSASSSSSSSSSSASRKTSKPGTAASAADALELGQHKGGGGSRGGLSAAAAAAAVGGTHDDEEAAQESLPLLRNVSREHAGWAGESVMVVAVQRDRSDGGGGGGGSRGAQ